MKQVTYGPLDSVVSVVARVDGVWSVVGVAHDRLNTLAPRVCSAAGVVVEIGRGVEDFAPGDRLASGAVGANHEILALPKNIVAQIPDAASLEDAAATSAGSSTLAEAA